MVTESYQKPKTPQIKFAGFYMLFCHSELVSESKNEKLKQVQLDKKEKRITSFSSRIASKCKYFGFPLYLQSGSRRPKLI